MTKSKAKAPIKVASPDLKIEVTVKEKAPVKVAPIKKAETKKPEVKKDYVAPKVEKVEAKAEPVKASKGFKAINSSTVCQLTRRADRTFGITV